MTGLLLFLSLALFALAAAKLAWQSYKPRLVSALAKHRAEEAAAGRTPRWAPDGEPRLLVVGTFYYQEALTTILKQSGSDEVSRIAVLVPYAHEKDEDAVRVEIDGLVVGHISRSENKAFRERLRAAFGANKVSCATAIITKGERSPEVRLKIKLK